MSSRAAEGPRLPPARRIAGGVLLVLACSIAGAALAAAPAGVLDAPALLVAVVAFGIAAGVAAALAVPAAFAVPQRQAETPKRVTQPLAPLGLERGRRGAPAHGRDSSSAS